MIISRGFKRPLPMSKNTIRFLPEINLAEIFDLVNIVPLDSTSFTGGIVQSAANNDIAGKNITTLALEIPIACLIGSGNNGVIGIWTSASKRQVSVLNPFFDSSSAAKSFVDDATVFNKTKVMGGALTQVSRLGAPLVNEVVIGLPDKNRFNASEPKNDGQFATYVTNPTLPFILDLLFRTAVGPTTDIAPTNFPRGVLVAAFLTGIKCVNQQSTWSAS